jgi:PAS domain S-box-containing protein
MEALENIAREQELQFELIVAVFEKIPDAIIVTDVDGTIRLINAKAEEIFGYHRTELQGQKVEILLPEAMRETHIGHRKHFWQDPKPQWMGEGRPLPAITKDGDEFQAQIMLAPHIIAQGRFMITVLRKQRPKANK